MIYLSRNKSMSINVYYEYVLYLVQWLICNFLLRFLWPMEQLRLLFFSAQILKNPDYVCTIIF
jgi:hypothetical protein